MSLSFVSSYTLSSSFPQWPPSSAPLAAAESLGASSTSSRSRIYTSGPNQRELLLVEDSRMLERVDATTRNTLEKSTGDSARGSAKKKPRSKRASHTSMPASIASTSKTQETGPFPRLHPSIPPPSTPPTPKGRVRSALKPTRSASEPGLTSVLETPTNGKGKRKAEDLDTTPPELRSHHATFVIPEEGQRTHRTSEVSRAPSSYHRKRARLSSSPTSSPAPSRPGSVQQQSSWPSRNSGPPQSLSRMQPKAASMRSNYGESATDRDRRRSISEISIPISALVAPHAPSLSMSSTYHMHDPRKPPRVMPTEWALRFRSQDEEGSPLQAWCFFIGFILFPLWWIASFSPIPKTREVGGTDSEKAVTIDNPQVEHDARTWRFRCRVMSAVSFLTYIPFIVLVAIFVPRR